MMSWNWDNHGLPFLPGNTFRDVTKTAFHRPQTLSYKNGFATSLRPTVGIGQDPLVSEQLIQEEMEDLSSMNPYGAYDSSDQGLVQEFIPAYVALDKKVLRFNAYFEEGVSFSPDEQCRVRPVVIYYYLEDDSMCIIEPVVENSGLLQGKRVKRQRLPKNELGDHYLWKDLNLSMDLPVYGVKYRITECDSFTKEFMESEGIILNDPEPMPVDPYSKRREHVQPVFTTPSDYDSRNRFQTLDQKVLCFSALWDESDSVYGETHPVTIHFFLVDDTVEVREVHKPNSGRDPFPVLMRRQKLPKKIKAESEIFPSCVLEVSKDEVDEYFSPKDFQLGRTIKLLGRCFLLYDCDGFTKEYYLRNHPELEMKPKEILKKTEKLQEKKKEIPPYCGVGSAEDSLQNCLSLHPMPPKKNVVKMLVHGNMALRYSAKLDTQNPEDEGRCFVLSYFLADDMISIFEKPTPNSGIIPGKFLRKARIPKPGSTVDKPDFYSPADFAIGATVEVFSHRFVLTGADLSVLKYLESIASEIPVQTLNSLKQHLGVDATEWAADTNGDVVAEASP